MVTCAAFGLPMENGVGERAEGRRAGADGLAEPAGERRHRGEADLRAHVDDGVIAGQQQVLGGVEAQRGEEPARRGVRGGGEHAVEVEGTVAEVVGDVGNADVLRKVLHGEGSGAHCRVGAHICDSTPWAGACHWWIRMAGWPGGPVVGAAGVQLARSAWAGPAGDFWRRRMRAARTSWTTRLISLRRVTRMTVQPSCSSVCSRAMSRLYWTSSSR